jgi:transcriptional regulator with XRE-family HTH domain
MTAAPAAVGARLRAERERRGLGVRELARRVDVSASLISQVELGKATPSVGTLYAIVSELGLSLDELFSGSAPAPAAEARRQNGRSDIDASHPPADQGDPVVRGDERKAIELDSGVRWERLTAVTERDVDFLYVVYRVGGASCAENSLIRHAGREYGHVIKGRLGVTVGFDTHELGPGDSIAFDSTVPHRLFNAGDEPAEGIWFVVGRGGDARITSTPQAT